MLRLLGFLFGVALAIVLLAAILMTPIREHAGALATDITGAIFDPANELELKQGDEVSKVNVPPPLVPGKQTLSKPATLKEAAKPSLPREGETLHEESITAGQSMGTTQPITQETEALPLQPASDAQKINSAAPGVWQEVSSVDPRTTDDVNEVSDEPVAWQPVWQAFRSELSAQGFAGHLQRLTGQDYRVRRTSPWSYQVELAYVDEGRRDAVLNEIQTKTGLGLVEMQP